MLSDVPFNASHDDAIRRAAKFSHVLDRYNYNEFPLVVLQGMKMKKHEELETPTFTTSIPIEVNDD